MPGGRIEAGLEFAAIENFEVEHWYDVLLDGPRRDEQMKELAKLLRTMGKLGIGVMGYSFSLVNVWGRTTVERARGGARSSRNPAGRPCRPCLHRRTAILPLHVQSSCLGCEPDT